MSASRYPTPFQSTLVRTMRYWGSKTGTFDAYFSPSENRVYFRKAGGVQLRAAKRLPLDAIFMGRYSEAADGVAFLADFFSVGGRDPS